MYCCAQIYEQISTYLPGAHQFSDSIFVHVKDSARAHTHTHTQSCSYPVKVGCLSLQQLLSCCVSLFLVILLCIAFEVFALRIHPHANYTSKKVGDSSCKCIQWHLFGLPTSTLHRLRWCRTGWAARILRVLQAQRLLTGMFLAPKHKMQC